MFEHLCKENGIVYLISMPHTHKQNGIAERWNRTLLEIVKLMLASANLPIFFYGEALLTTTHILNRIPSKLVEKTPYKLWNSKPPKLNYLRV